MHPDAPKSLPDTDIALNGVPWCSLCMGMTCGANYSAEMQSADLQNSADLVDSELVSPW